MRWERGRRALKVCRIHFFLLLYLFTPLSLLLTCTTTSWLRLHEHGSGGWRRGHHGRRTHRLCGNECGICPSLEVVHAIDLPWWRHLCGAAGVLTDGFLDEEGKEIWEKWRKEGNCFQLKTAYEKLQTSWWERQNWPYVAIASHPDCLHKWAGQKLVPLERVRMCVFVRVRIRERPNLARMTLGNQAHYNRAMSSSRPLSPQDGCTHGTCERRSFASLREKRISKPSINLPLQVPHNAHTHPHIRTRIHTFAHTHLEPEERCNPQHCNLSLPHHSRGHCKMCSLARIVILHAHPSSHTFHRAHTHPHTIIFTIHPPFP